MIEEKTRWQMEPGMEGHFDGIEASFIIFHPIRFLKIVWCYFSGHVVEPTGCQGDLIGEEYVCIKCGASFDCFDG